MRANLSYKSSGEICDGLTQSAATPADVDMHQIPSMLGPQLMHFANLVGTYKAKAAGGQPPRCQPLAFRESQHIRFDDNTSKFIH